MGSLKLGRGRRKKAGRKKRTQDAEILLGLRAGGNCGLLAGLAGVKAAASRRTPK